MLLSKYLRAGNLAGDVGVEIEVEGVNLPNVRTDDWVTVPDGSLRDGLEYIFNGPKPIERVPELLDNLNKSFAKSKLSFSFRTSVHVHLNCLGLNEDQVKAVIFAYLLLEPVLLRQTKPVRHANRFCLGLHNAEGLVELLREFFASPSFRPICALPEPVVRYASLGVASLRKHGTLEVRCMHGTNNPKELLPWIGSLHQLKTFAADLGSPEAVYEHLITRDAKSFISDFLFEEYYHPSCDDLVYRNLSLSFDVLAAYRNMPPPPPEGVDLQDYDDFVVDDIGIYYEV